MIDLLMGVFYLAYLLYGMARKGAAIIATTFRAI